MKRRLGVTGGVAGAIGLCLAVCAPLIAGAALSGHEVGGGPRGARFGFGGECDVLMTTSFLQHGLLESRAWRYTLNLESIESMTKQLGIAVALSLISWAGAQAQTPKSPPSVPGKIWSFGTLPKIALTDGEVERVDKEHGEVVINHGDLPNLGMGPMTMGFAVADKRMLDRLKAGDKVRFDAEIRKGEATVTYIEASR